MCELIKAAGLAGVKNLKYRDLEINFSDMAGFEEVDLSKISHSKVANDDNIYDNEVDEKDLTEHEEPMNLEDFEELAYTDPVEYERIQAGGEINA